MFDREQISYWFNILSESLYQYLQMCRCMKQIFYISTYLSILSTFPPTNIYLYNTTKIVKYFIYIFIYLLIFQYFLLFSLTWEGEVTLPHTPPKRTVLLWFLVTGNGSTSRCRVKTNTFSCVRLVCNHVSLAFFLLHSNCNFLLCAIWWT